MIRATEDSLEQTARQGSLGFLGTKGRRATASRGSQGTAVGTGSREIRENRGGLDSKEMQVTVRLRANISITREREGRQERKEK